MSSAYIYSQNPYGGITGQGGVQFSVGRVKEIVLGEFRYDGTKDPNYKTPKDVGKISYEPLYVSINFPSGKGASRPAYPIFSAVKQYPLLNEIVLIVPGPDSNLNDSIEEQGLYYFPPYSLWNSSNHNAFPNLQEYAEFVKTEIQNVQMENRELNSEEVGKLPLGYMFSENRDVRGLRPFEGDTIVESRFGQSIRFGSSNITNTMNPWSRGSATGTPITIIRNGQGNQDTTDYFQPTVENINRDPSSIWMTAGQTVNIEDALSYPLNSFGETNKVQASSAQKVEKVAKSAEIVSKAQQDSTTLRR